MSGIWNISIKIHWNLINRPCSCKLYLNKILKCKYHDNLWSTMFVWAKPILQIVSWTFKGEDLNVYYDGTWIPNNSFSSIYIFLVSSISIYKHTKCSWTRKTWNTFSLGKIRFRWSIGFLNTDSAQFAVCSSNTDYMQFALPSNHNEGLGVCWCFESLTRQILYSVIWASSFGL